MAWMYLLIAGIFEWGWPVGLKLGVSDKGFDPIYLSLAGVSMFLSGFFLLRAQKEIPMGTAYATWTGIGAVGAFVLGIVLFEDPVSLERFFFIVLIVIGIIGLQQMSGKNVK